MNTQMPERPEEFRSTANPFPGLRPFEFDESHLFFGRDGLSDELIGRLRRTRFLTVIGTSGSGKSSLVRAGLLPALVGGMMPGAGSSWRIAIMRPGNDPLGNLARALREQNILDLAPGADPMFKLAMVDAALRRGDRGLVEVVEQSTMEPDENLLIVVDQFEELFRFQSLEAGRSLEGEAADFVQLLLEGSRQQETPIYVVLALRSDFIGDCSIFWGLPEAINRGLFSIPRMNRRQRAEAIMGPLKVIGGSMAPQFLDRLLNDVSDNPDQLPILQHTLMRLWESWRQDPSESLGLNHYNSIGTMANALSQHADEAFFDLGTDRTRWLAEVLFKALVERGTDNREIRRPTTVGEVCEIAHATEQEIGEVIETFRREDRSLLMPPPGVQLNGHTLIDISHESLIRNWGRLKKWVDDEASSARMYKRIAETAMIYDAGEAGLWRDPDLALALRWREEKKPNEAWARRYHPEFDAAMQFLNNSSRAQEAESREREHHRQRSTRGSRSISILMFVLFILTLVALIFVYTKRV